MTINLSCYTPLLGWVTSLNLEGIVHSSWSSDRTRSQSVKMFSTTFNRTPHSVCRMGLACITASAHRMKVVSL